MIPGRYPPFGPSVGGLDMATMGSWARFQAWVGLVKRGLLLGSHLLNCLLLHKAAPLLMFGRG